MWHMLDRQRRRWLQQPKHEMDSQAATHQATDGLRGEKAPFRSFCRTGRKVPSLFRNLRGNEADCPL
eukprot:5366531-Pleurochrysis_carterae.AAC.1